MDNDIFGLILFGCFILALYFLPGIIAFRRKLRSAVAITFLNLFFGWTGLGWLIALIWSLWREKPLPEGAPKRSKLSGFLRAVMIALMLTPLSCPYVVTGVISRDAARIIPLLENYKAQRGAYPKGLEELGVPIKYDDRGVWGMRYGVSDDGKEFWLACYSITPSPFQLRRVYRSATREWETID